MKVLTHAAALSVSLFLLGCEQASSTPPSGGATNTRVEANVQGNWVGENTYQNEHFDLQLTIPEEWFFEKGLNQAAADLGTDLLVGEDDTKRQLISAALKNTQTPFMAYRYPPGTPGKPNPNVICMIEKIAHLPGIKTAGDYLRVMEETLKGSNVKVSYEADPQQTELGGLKFTQRNQNVDMGFTKVNQRTYAKKEGDYIMIFTVTILSEGDNAIVNELLNTISKMEDDADAEPVSQKEPE